MSHVRNASCIFEHWKSFVKMYGYTIEPAENGDFLAIDQDGKEVGQWDADYGGAGFGWFD
jgi:hypothetical protein